MYWTVGDGMSAWWEEVRSVPGCCDIALGCYWLWGCTEASWLLVTESAESGTTDVDGPLHCYLSWSPGWRHLQHKEMHRCFFITLPPPCTHSSCLKQQVWSLNTHTALSHCENFTCMPSSHQGACSLGQSCRQATQRMLPAPHRDPEGRQMDSNLPPLLVWLSYWQWSWENMWFLVLCLMSGGRTWLR